MFKRYLILLAMTLTILAGGTFAQTRQKIQGYCEDGGQTVTTDGRTSTTKVQRSYPSCTVTVYDGGTTTLSTIYSDESGTPKANPFVADANGGWSFYGGVGRYDTKFSGGGITTPFTRSGWWVVVPGGGGGGLSGGGTANRIAKWSGASSLDNSILNQVGTSEITLVNGRFNLQSKQQVLEVANEGVTGTTQDRLAKLTGAPSTAILAGTSDTSGILGIVVASAGTTGSAQIAIAGRYNCEFDGATTAGNYVVSSSTTAGKCADGGATPPTTRQVIGRVLSTNGASGTYEILLTGPGGYSAAGSYMSGGTINAGTTGDLGYYASNGTTISPLGKGSTFTISGGVLKTQTLRNAVNALDYGADPTGVSNSTTALQNWITACQAAGGFLCYLPGGTYLTDPITQSINGLRIEGDGREKSILKARVVNNPIINITSANFAVNFTINGIGFEGQGKSSGTSGHCVSISDATGGTAQFSIENSSFINCGGKGLYIPYMFAGRFKNLLFDEIGDNHLEVQGGSASVFEGLDFKTVEANKIGLWVYSGNPVLIANNGIEPDSGAGSIWGRFGRSLADGDGADSYVLGATFTGNNVEDFKSKGWEFRTGSGGSTYSGNTFISPSSGTVTAIYFQFLSGTELGIWSGGTFTLQGTAAWTNSQPVHARGYAPFYVSGTNTPTDFYEWNAAEVRSLPYVRPELLAGTTENGLKVSNFFSDAIFNSSLAGSLTGTTDPSGNASRIILQSGSASRPVYSFSGDSDSGMYSSLGNLLWSTDGTLRMTLNNSYGLVLGNNATGTGKFTAQGLSASTGFYVRTASAPGSQGGLVMPFEGGGLTFGPGIWWAGGAYNAISGLWLSNGLNWQSASSTHSQWKIRKSTGTSGEGDIVLNLHPDDGYIGLNPFGTSAGNTSETRYLELAANGANYVGFKAPDNIATTRIWTLPSADGSASQCLQTNGSGVLSFGACSGSSSLTVGTTTITGGTTTRVLYNNAGVLGEYAVTGTGNAVLSASPTLTGTVAAAGATFSGTITQTSASATAFESGPNGSTNPVFRLVNSTASSATGLSITGNAAGSGVTLTALSSGSNEGITINAKGTGNITINNQAVISGMTIGGNDIFRAGRIQIGTSTSNVLDFYTNNTIAASFGGSTGAVRSFGLGSDMAFGFANTSSPSGATLDITLRRAAAANLAFGAADAAAPVAQTLSVQNVVAGTSNTAGANWTFAGSRGTGTGAGGAIIWQIAPAGSSGTSQNALVETMRLDGNGIRLPEISSAATPATNNVYLYAKDKTGVSTLYYKKDDGTEVEIGSGGSGTPGGSNTQIQYNNAGSFGGISGLTTNGSTTLVQTSSNAAAFESGPNGSTNPVFRLVNNVVSAATGLSITGNAAGSGVTLTALSSGTNEDIVINPKGSGAIRIGTGPFARFDSSHNSSFTTSTGVIKLGNDFWMSSNLAAVGLNTYYNGANFVYAQTDPAFLFGFNASRNAFKIQAAASGTGGSTVNFSAGLAVLSDATVGVNKESSTGAQFHAVSGSSSRVALRADSASSNTVDIAQFTVNGSTTAGNYVGLASGGAVKVRRQTYSGSGTQTLNLANGTVHELTVTGTTTVALSNIQNGGFYILAIIQDATGGRSVTLPSTIKLPGGSWIFTTTANARDEFHCYSDGTNLYCMPQADVK